MSAPVLSPNDNRSQWLLYAYVAAVFLAFRICEFSFGSDHLLQMYSLMLTVPMIFIVARFLINDPSFLISETREYSSFGDQIHFSIHRGLRFGAKVSIAISVVIFVFRTLF